MKKVTITQSQFNMLKESSIEHPTIKKIYITEDQHKRLFLLEQGAYDKDKKALYVPKSRKETTTTYGKVDGEWVVKGEKEFNLYIYPPTKVLGELYNPLYVLRNEWKTCCVISDITGNNVLESITDEKVIESLDRVYPSARITHHLFPWDIEEMDDWSPLVGELKNEELKWPAFGEKGEEHLQVSDFCKAFPSVYPSYTSTFNNLSPEAKSVVNRIIQIAHSDCVDCAGCMPTFWGDCASGGKWMGERLACAIKQFSLEYMIALQAAFPDFYKDGYYVSGSKKIEFGIAEQVDQVEAIFNHFATELSNSYEVCHHLDEKGDKNTPAGGMFTYPGASHNSQWYRNVGGGYPDFCEKPSSLDTLTKWGAELFLCANEYDQWVETDDWTDMVHCIVDMLSIGVSAIPYYGTAISAILDGANAAWYLVEAGWEALDQYGKPKSEQDWEKVYWDLGSAGLSGLGVIPGVSEYVGIGKLLKRGGKQVREGVEKVLTTVQKRGQVMTDKTLKELMDSATKGLSAEQAKMVKDILKFTAVVNKKGTIEIIKKESQLIKSVFERAGLASKAKAAARMRILKDPQFLKLVEKKGSLSKALTIHLLKKSGKLVGFQTLLLGGLSWGLPLAFRALGFTQLPEWEENKMEELKNTYGDQGAFEKIWELWYIFGVLNECDIMADLAPEVTKDYPSKAKKCLEKGGALRKRKKMIDAVDNGGFIFPSGQREIIKLANNGDTPLPVLSKAINTYFPIKFRKYYNDKEIGPDGEPIGISLKDLILNNEYYTEQGECYPKCTVSEENMPGCAAIYESECK